MSTDLRVSEEQTFQAPAFKAPDDISKDEAKALVRAAWEYARENGYPPLGVCVFNAKGEIVYEDTDNARPEFPNGPRIASPELARGKARAAIEMQMDGEALGKVAADRLPFAVALMSKDDGPFVMGPGSYQLIREAEDGQPNLVGSIGISGAQPGEDANAARHAIEKVGNFVVPKAP